jgi:hypothetical protein
MFEDFSSQEEQLSEQKESRFDPVEENIIKEIGVPVEMPPQGRAESISEAILELPPELQVPAIEMVVEDALDVKVDSALANILRNIIKTELGRGLEQDLKNKIVDLAYEINDIDLQKTLLDELEKAGILVRKYKGSEDIRRVEATKKVIPVKEEVDAEERIIDEADDIVDEVEDFIDEVVEEVEIIETKKFDFSGEVPPEGWALGGAALLTAENGIDEIGQGWLRITENSKNQLGYAIYDNPLQTDRGLTFNFDYSIWSPGYGGGEGMTFFLVDGKTELENFSPGSAHANLGYGPNWSGKGMTNAIVAIALDANGNFSTESKTRPGGLGVVKDSVSVRAGSNAEVPFDYIAGTDQLSDRGGKGGINIDAQSERPDQSGENYRNVNIIFTPHEEHYRLDVTIQIGAGTEPLKVLENIDLRFEMPETVKFGFSATTTGATSNHEVNNVVVQEGVGQESASNEMKGENIEMVEIEQEPEKIEQTKEVVQQPALRDTQQAADKSSINPGTAEISDGNAESN